MEIDNKVYYKGNHIYDLSSDLIELKNLDQKTVTKISRLHTVKTKIYDLITKTKTKTRLRDYGKMLENLEFKLQKLWKFPLQRRYHRFWETPKCECPKLDNLDAYPYASIVNKKCPIHGFE